MQRHDGPLDVIESVAGLSPKTMHAYPSSFGGSQRLRIGIEGLIALAARVAADEPVASLDVASVRAQVRVLHGNEGKTRVHG